MSDKTDYNKYKFRYISHSQRLNASDSFFNILIGEDKNTDNKILDSFLIKIIDHVFNRIEKLQIIKRCDVYNEIEAAIFLRLSNPETSGRQSVRYYALNAKQLTYLKIGRDGLLFTKSDLENFLENQKVQSYRNF
jgi:hypothetical protein